MTKSKKYHFIIFDNFSESFRHSLDNKVAQSEVSKFCSVLLRNLLNSLPVQELSDIFFISGTPLNGSLPETESSLITTLPTISSLLAAYPEIKSGGSISVFIALSTLGLSKIDLINTLGFLDTDEDCSVFISDSKSNVALIGINRWQDGLLKLNFLSPISLDSLFKTFSLIQTKLDRLSPFQSLVVTYDANALHNLVSDRRSTIFDDSSLYKELNLLFIEHKELISK